MVGSIITRAIIMVLGYIYPAYECFKCVERIRPDMDHLRFWCQYWMIIALVTVSERLGDALISWLPMYSEAKLAFIIYLWYPKTKGTTYVYTAFLRPFVAQHEPEIDRTLNELSTRAKDILFLYWKWGSTFFQARFVELLHYLASQSPRNSAPPPAPRVYPPTSRPGSASGSPSKSRRPSNAQPPPPPPGYPGTPPQGYPGVPAGYNGPPPPGYAIVSPGSMRHRPAITAAAAEVDGFHMVDKSFEPSAPPYYTDEPPVAPTGYLTRSRQRAAGTRA